MNREEIFLESRTKKTDEEWVAIDDAIILTARTCAATVCAYCETQLNDGYWPGGVKSIGPAHKLENWMTYQHSVEYLDGGQYYWVCEADKMWKELEK